MDDEQVREEAAEEVAKEEADRVAKEAVEQVSKAVRKLRKLKRHELLARVETRWDKLKSHFEDRPGVKAKSLSNACLRSLLATKQPCHPLKGI